MSGLKHATLHDVQYELMCSLVYNSLLCLSEVDPVYWMSSSADTTNIICCGRRASFVEPCWLVSCFGVMSHRALCRLKDFRIRVALFHLSDDDLIIFVKPVKRSSKLCWMSKAASFQPGLNTITSQIISQVYHPVITLGPDYLLKEWHFTALKLFNVIFLRNVCGHKMQLECDYQEVIESRSRFEMYGTAIFSLSCSFYT